MQLIMIRQYAMPLDKGQLAKVKVTDKFVRNICFRS